MGGLHYLQNARIQWRGSPIAVYSHRDDVVEQQTYFVQHRRILDNCKARSLACMGIKRQRK